MASLGGTNTRKYKEEVEEEREALKEELRAQLRAQLLPEVRTEVQKAFDQARPSRDERESAMDFLRQVEFDSAAQFRACIKQAEWVDDRTRLLLPLHRTLIYVLAVGLLPFIYFGGQRFHWIADGALTGEAWFTVLPAVVALIIAVVSYLISAEAKSDSIRQLRARAKAHSDLAEQARHGRQVRLATATREQVSSMTNDMMRVRERAGDQFAEVPVRILDLARKEVRELLVTEVDPEKLWRVATPVSPDEDEEVPTSNKTARA